MIFGVEQRHRERAEILERGLGRRLLRGGNHKRELEPGHRVRSAARFEYVVRTRRAAAEDLLHAPVGPA